MSRDRRVLGLPKTPAQKATERHEDALLQKVATSGEAEDVQLKPLTFKEEPYAGASPPEHGAEEEVILLDESVPYATVRGVRPGVEFVQGRNFFNRGKQFVMEAPIDQWYFSEVTAKKVSDMDRAEAARHELRTKGLWEDVPRLPKAMLDIEKENARAAAAEQHAA